MGFDYEAYRRDQQGDPDKGLLTTFEYRAENVAGKIENVPYIRIYLGKNDEVVRRLTEEDKERFKDRWEAFQKKEKLPEEGTPISLCPFATPANVAACKEERIFTVEQIVEVPDSRLQRAHLIEFKYMCRDWLEARVRNEHLPQLRAENEKLKGELESLKEKFHTTNVDELLDEIETLKSQIEELKKPKRRGRPRKHGNANDAG